MSRSKICKVAVYGAEKTGKTNLVNKLAYSNKPFTDQYKPTIGADFLTKEYMVDDKKMVFQIWDTAGQERFKTMGISFTQDADINIICVDLSTPLHLQFVDNTINEIEGSSGAVEKPLILVWTKDDADPAISERAKRDLATDKEYNFAKVITVSSKESRGMAELLGSMARIFKGEAQVAIEPDEAIEHTNDSSLSPFQASVIKLEHQLENVPSEKKKLIGVAFQKLMDVLLDEESDVESQFKAVDAFEKEATGHLGGAYPKIGAAIVGVVVAAIVTIIAAAVGFGIGFAAGAWMGPGAFLSGVLAGSAAACGVVAVSASCGIGLGLFSLFSSHASAMEQNKPIYDFVEEIEMQI